MEEWNDVRLPPAFTVAAYFRRVCLSSSGPTACLPYTKLSASERAHDLVGRMTLDEKAAQLEDWATAIPRLGIPDYQTWNESLHGVARAGYATVFPQAIGMAATWDTTVVNKMGNVISAEARAKYNQAQREGNHRIFYGLTFWSPNINIFRDPRWGRGQETYGEDPFLTGRLGIAFIGGVQGGDPDHLRAVATSKHFAVHSGPEQLRHGFNVNPSERDLEETYLPAFRATVTEGKVQSVMCAYNSIDEWPACTNKMLLKDHLRDAWGFKGFVVSDCGAIVDVNQGHKKTPDITHSAALSLQAGTDLSCSIWTPGFNKLADAVRQGLVSEDLVTQAAERLYKARFQLGLFDPQGSNSLDKIPFTDAASIANRIAARKAAEESIVLLKNNGALPLKSEPGHIAVIGPIADQLTSILGNYVCTRLHPVTPLEGIMNQFKSSPILYAQGSTLAEGVGVPVPRTAFGLNKGLKTEFFATSDWTGRLVASETEPAVQSDWKTRSPFPRSTRTTTPFAGAEPSQRPRPATTSLPSKPPTVSRTRRLKAIASYSTARSSVKDPCDRRRYLRDGQLQGCPRSSPTAPPIMKFPKPASVAVDFADTKEHDFRFENSLQRRRWWCDTEMASPRPGTTRRSRSTRKRSKRRGRLCRPLTPARRRGDAHQDPRLRGRRPHQPRSPRTSTETA